MPIDEIEYKNSCSPDRTDFVLISIGMVLIGLFLLLYYYYDVERDPLTTSSSTFVWYDAQIEVHFNDGSIQNYTLKVWGTLDNIKVSNGNLYYTKFTNRQEGDSFVVVHKVELASFVKYYKVVNSERKIQVEE